MIENLEMSFPSYLFIYFTGIHLPLCLSIYSFYCSSGSSAFIRISPLSVSLSLTIMTSMNKMENLSHGNPHLGQLFVCLSVIVCLLLIVWLFKRAFEHLVTSRFTVINIYWTLLWFAISKHINYLWKFIWFSIISTSIYQFIFKYFSLSSHQLITIFILL